MTYIDIYLHHLLNIILLLQKQNILMKNVDTHAVQTFFPHNPDHGHLSTNAAFVMARGHSLTSSQVADKIITHLSTLDIFQQIEKGREGFVNVWFKDSFWWQQLAYLLKQPTLIKDQSLAQIDFDFSYGLEHTQDNQLFNIHYTHTRCYSVLRYGQQLWGELDFAQVQYHYLKQPEEFELLKLLAAWPRTKEGIALLIMPAKIICYLNKVAMAFQNFWDKAKIHNHLRFIDPINQESSMARLALIKTTAYIIASGLLSLGMNPVEEIC